jgi:osmoprotectant transport system ATP-binding protein
LILDGVSFSVQPSETLVLLGRSGSGKTTALKLINRMLEPASGEVLIEGRMTTDYDPVALRRKIGYVVQEFGLLPHWTVGENVALVPRLLRWPKEKQHARAAELLEAVGLGREVRTRYPHQLSGGQRQRVGVARALAAEPLLLLFDEPFGALDPITRHEMQELFLDIRKRYRGASVFVTHDLLEALALGTRIGVIEAGRLEGVFSPQEFRRVETPFAKALLQMLPPGVTVS